MKKKIIIIVVTVLVLLGGGIAAFLLLSRPPQTEAPTPQSVKETFDKSRYSIDEPGSIWWIVNKKRPIAGDYVPVNLTAPDIKLRWAADAESMQVSTQIAPALKEMATAAKAAGFDLMLISGYRSIAYQKELYDGYVTSRGQEEADRVSARPGTSEHHTGLAIDLGRADKQCELEECFGDTPEGKWLAQHAHEYGFIIRYPKDKEVTVGYMYEPWHLRFVGRELAAELHAQGETMEEFFGL